MKNFLYRTFATIAGKREQHPDHYIAPTMFNAYLERGMIHEADDHETVGITPQELQRVIAMIKHPDFLYARTRNYGTSFYKRDNTSPTGVIEFGGVSNEFSFIVDALTHIGPLSPTEDLRTAR